MLRREWYAVAASKKLSTEPIRVSVHGEDLVLFRDDSGNPYAIDAYCPHRGCDLSLGVVNNGELICPFHGWRFNTVGKCTHIPAHSSGRSVPSAARLPVYPACDKAGLLWVFTDPRVSYTDVPPLELFPELGSLQWSTISFETTWEAHFSRTVESVLDVSHLPFVHPETTGTGVSPVVDALQYSVSSRGLIIHPKSFSPAHPMEPVMPPEGIDEQTEIELLFPNRWIIRTPMGDERWMCTFLTFTPFHQHVTGIFGMVMRNFEIDSLLLDEFHLAHTQFVMNQDKEIIEHLRPIAPPDLKKEMHVPSDGPTIRFRRMLFDRLKQEAFSSNLKQGENRGGTLKHSGGTLRHI